MWEGKNPPTDTRGFFEAVKWSRSSYEVGGVIEHAGPDGRKRYKARTIVTAELRHWKRCLMVPRVVKEPSPSTNSFMTSPGEEGNDRTDNRSRKSRRPISSRSLHAECGSRSRVFSPRKLKLARARCCARAASGHAAAAPPRSVMNVRRFTRSPRRRGREASAEFRGRAPWRS